MTEHEAARRYLQASMNAGYTGLPDEHREAHEDTMRQLERRFPGVADRALAGADQDFDKPLAAGEREHQAYLRRREGLQHSDVLQMRKDMRSGDSRRRSSPKGRRPSPAHAARAGAAGGRAYARARREVLSSSGVQDTGAIVLQAVGVAVGLSLLYLVLSSKGSAAFTTLLNGITKFTRLLVGPYDPLNPPKAASPATGPVNTNVLPAQSSTGGPVFGAPYVDVLAPGPITPKQKEANKAFGPAPTGGTATLLQGGLG